MFGRDRVSPPPEPPRDNRGRRRITRSPEAFVANARSLMVAKALAVSDIARKSYLDKMVFYRIFGKEQAAPSLEAALEIAEALGTTVDELSKTRAPDPAAGS